MDIENTTPETTKDDFTTELLKGALSKSVASAAGVLTTLLITAAVKKAFALKAAHDAKKNAETIETPEND